MDKAAILAQLKQAQNSRRLGHAAYTKGRLKEAERHFQTDCAEVVLKAAKVCKHCGRKLDDQ